jgi:hypothetical protein
MPATPTRACRKRRFKVGVVEYSEKNIPFEEMV